MHSFCWDRSDGGDFLSSLHFAYCKRIVSLVSLLLAILLFPLMSCSFLRAYLTNATCVGRGPTHGLSQGQERAHTFSLCEIQDVIAPQKFRV